MVHSMQSRNETIKGLRALGGFVCTALCLLIFEHEGVASDTSDIPANKPGNKSLPDKIADVEVVSIIVGGYGVTFSTTGVKEAKYPTMKDDITSVIVSNEKIHKCIANLLSSHLTELDLNDVRPGHMYPPTQPAVPYEIIVHKNDKTIDKAYFYKLFPPEILSAIKLLPGQGVKAFDDFINRP
jgi:hypothetical protein